MKKLKKIIIIRDEQSIVLNGVLVFSWFFFVRFLVFELLTILYFTVVNSDLGLGRFAGKQHSLELKNMPLKLTCTD